MEVISFVYPAWHNRSLRPEFNPEKKFNEWDLVRFGKGYFVGHNQPRRPHSDIGYYDDTKVETSEKQIDIASAYGVDVLTYLFYWNRGKRELIEPLDKAFLVSSNKNKIRFSLMWCWKTPRRNFPVYQGANHLYESERIVATNEDDFSNMIDYCCNNYFKNENYWKIDGKPVFFMYTLQGFCKILGKDYFRMIIKKGREVAVKKGFCGLYLVGITWSSLYTDDSAEIGFDMLTTYVFLPDFEGQPIQKYSNLIEKRMSDWKDIRLRSSVEFFPSVSPGWDGSSRGVFDKNILGREKSIFPWTPIVTECNPDIFGDFANEAASFSLGKYLFVASWNEWSEGHAIEPDMTNGYRLLEKIWFLKKSYL